MAKFKNKKSKGKYNYKNVKINYNKPRVINNTCGLVNDITPANNNATIQYQLTNSNYNVANNQNPNSLPTSVTCSDAGSLSSHWVAYSDNDANNLPEPQRSAELKVNSLYRLLCGKSQSEIDAEVAKCSQNGYCDPTDSNAPFSLDQIQLNNSQGFIPLSLFLASSPCTCYTPGCVPKVAGLNSDGDTSFINPYNSYCTINNSNIPSDITSPYGSPIASNSLTNRDQTNVFYNDHTDQVGASLIPVPNVTNSISGSYKPDEEQGITPPYNQFLVWDPENGVAPNDNYQKQLNNLNLFFSEPQTNPADNTQVCCIGPEGNCTTSGGGTVNSYTFPVNPYSGSAATIYPTVAQITSCLGKPVKYGCSSGPNGSGVCIQSAIGNYDTLAECQSSCGCFGCVGGKTCQVVTPSAGLNCPFISSDACENGTGCSIPTSSNWIFYLILGIVFFIALYFILRAISNKL